MFFHFKKNLNFFKKHHDKRKTVGSGHAVNRKNMIAVIKDFIEKVMDLFASIKNRRMEFIFKQIIGFGYLIYEIWCIIQYQ